MVEPSQTSGGRNKPRQQPFALDPEVSGPSFRPVLYPERIQVTKEREIDRQKNFCSEEDATDNGSKNRDIHVNGPVTNNQLDALNTLGEVGEPYTLVTATWSGEVLVSTIEIEGPTGWWPQRGTMLWEYRIDLVSTGKDEGSSQGNNGGIISGGGVGDEDLRGADQSLFEAAEEQDAVDDATSNGGQTVGFSQ